MAMLRKIQGLHAPLKLQMERKSVLKVGHLPFLPRHHVAHDVLTGILTTNWHVCMVKGQVEKHLF